MHLSTSSGLPTDVWILWDFGDVVNVHASEESARRQQDRLVQEYLGYLAQGPHPGRYGTSEQAEAYFRDRCEVSRMSLVDEVTGGPRA